KVREDRESAQSVWWARRPSSVGYGLVIQRLRSVRAESRDGKSKGSSPARAGGFQEEVRGCHPEEGQGGPPGHDPHDRFTLVDPSGTIIGKDGLINEIVHDQSNFMDSFVRIEHSPAVHVDGTARETADVKLKGRKAGRVVTGTYVNAITYIRGPKGWQFL